MNDDISRLLEGLNKPSRRYKQMTVRVTDAEFMQLESHAHTRFTNVSDVVRLAITAYLNPTNTNS
jgi:hypothetical protein